MRLSPVFRGSDTSILFELTHKMQVGLISAEETQLIDAHIRCGQIESGERYAGKDDIVLTGAAKKSPVQMLKMGAAQAQGICKLIDRPVGGGRIVDLCADIGKFAVIFLGVRDSRTSGCLFQFFVKCI